MAGSEVIPRPDADWLLGDIIKRAVLDRTDGDIIAVKEVQFDVKMEMEHKDLVVVYKDEVGQAPDKR